MQIQGFLRSRTGESQRFKRSETLSPVARRPRQPLCEALECRRMLSVSVAWRVYSSMVLASVDYAQQSAVYVSKGTEPEGGRAGPPIASGTVFPLSGNTVDKPFPPLSGSASGSGGTVTGTVSGTFAPSVTYGTTTDIYSLDETAECSATVSGSGYVTTTVFADMVLTVTDKPVTVDIGGIHIVGTPVGTDGTTRTLDVGVHEIETYDLATAFATTTSTLFPFVTVSIPASGSDLSAHFTSLPTSPIEPGKAGKAAFAVTNSGTPATGTLSVSGFKLVPVAGGSAIPISATASATIKNDVTTPNPIPLNFTVPASTPPGKYNLMGTLSDGGGIVDTDTADKTLIGGIIQVLPTLGSITGKLGSESRTSLDNHLAITNSNVFAVPQSNGKMALTADHLNSSAPSVLQDIKWVVERNAADRVTASLPSLVQNSSNRLEANVGLNSVGSFNIIVYYDANSNGTLDPQEVLRVFHIAEVSVRVKVGGTIATSNSHFTAKDDGASTVIKSGDFYRNGLIQLTETVQVVGGGANGMIGVSKIHVGWLQNASSDNFTVSYKNGKKMVEALKSGTFPILDATYDVGGYSVYMLPPFQPPVPESPGPTRDPVRGSDGGGGEDRVVSTADSPGVSFHDALQGSPAEFTDGTNNFATYLAAYSDDYSSSYAGSMVVNWSALFRFTKGSNGKWANSGSAVTYHVQTLSTPTLLSSLGVKTSGPLFNRSYVMVVKT